VVCYVVLCQTTRGPTIGRLRSDTLSSTGCVDGVVLNWTSVVTNRTTRGPQQDNACFSTGFPWSSTGQPRSSAWSLTGLLWSATWSSTGLPWSSTWSSAGLRVVLNRTSVVLYVVICRTTRGHLPDLRGPQHGSLMDYGGPLSGHSPDNTRSSTWSFAGLP